MLAAIFFAEVFLAKDAAGESFKKDVLKGNALYNDKEYEKSIASYAKALEKSPDDPVANFNLGNARYKNSDFAKAVESYNKALVRDDSLRAKGDYNIGNAKYRRAKTQSPKDAAFAMKNLKEALEYYKRTMELDP
jgi:tetratricopeptide (TPR) repeat protein